MEKKTMIPRVKLGTQGLEVSKLGFGCMGLTGVYNSPLTEEKGIAIIKHALKKGNLDKLELIMQALKELLSEEIQLATKFGIASISKDGGFEVNGRPEYVSACCEASLERLQVDYIDLYYQHRIDQTVPIEETIGELKKLVEEGKVKYIGLSEASPDRIKRLMQELGIGIVPYSPLGQGFFGGKGVTESLSENTALVQHPRFTGENLEKNKALYVRVENLAKKHECITAQLALACVLHQGDDVVPIPGTTKIKNLDSNIGALQISDLVPDEEVAGARSFFGTDEKFCWKYADTPLPSSA
ncbi:Aldo-keto reductase protein [Dioscorea alata]|uniref:Aldo-keto reductase protein n=1 Tax=Dioscorea alata TaxID=55571 RepID=A0ACB7ULS6_DIOAL|nr:Aldo-keto reductase protein [Dioscorea alata]